MIQPPFFLPFSFPNVSNVKVFFTTAATGNMALSETLPDAEKKKLITTKQVLKSHFSIKEWVEVHQVHEDAMEESPKSFDIHCPPSTPADGLHTTKKGYALTIRTADCQPILFTHKEAKFVAAIHVGWRGNTINFPFTAVKQLCEAHAVSPSEIMAVRGPSLGPGASEFINFEKEWDVSFRPWFSEETKKMDLWSLTKHQLEQAGIQPSQIFSIDMCTYSLPEYFFSYRRKHAGRQTAAIWIAS